MVEVFKFIDREFVPLDDFRILEAKLLAQPAGDTVTVPAELWRTALAALKEAAPPEALPHGMELMVRQAIIDWNRSHDEPPLNIDRHQEGALAGAVLNALMAVRSPQKEPT